MTSRVVVYAASFVAIVFVLQVLTIGRAHADHDKFRYKWPYVPGASYEVNGTPYTDHHGCPALQGVRSCTDAWDIDIADFNVRSSAAGPASLVVNSIDPTTCVLSGGASGPGGLGNQVRVAVPGGPEVWYGHLESPSVSEGSSVRQGDRIGEQGFTGSTWGSTPTPCGNHLHIAFSPSTKSNPGRPSTIDGQSVVSNLTVPGPSTNSRVGELSNTGTITTPSLAIRVKYIADGVTYGGGNSWSFFGWTADLVSPSPPPVPQVGCAPSNPYCQLYVHYEPDPQAGHWGSILDFKKHPENVLIGGTVVPFDANAIMSGRWDIVSAYTVRLPFYLAWLLGDTETVISLGTGDIGLSLMDEIGIDWPLCDPLTACVGYQRFSHGYIWKHAVTGIQMPIFCPDVSAPQGQWPDHLVDLVFDIIGVVDHWIPLGYGGQPYEWSEYAQFDVNGDGVVDLVTDILGVIDHFQQKCYPQ